MSSSAAAPGAASPGARRRAPDPTPAGKPGRVERRTKRATERRLRSTVRRLAGCLTELPLRERRVLVLRSGLGPGPAVSRAATGNRLDIATRRVGRIERRGLRRLRSAAGGGCGAATAVTIELALASTGVGGGDSPPASGALTTASAGDGSGGGGDRSGTGGSDGGGTDGSGVKGVFDSSGGDRSAVAVPPVGTDGGGFDFSIVALVVGLFLLGYALRRELTAGGPTAG